ncbi:MAG: hypothetical protein LBD41_06415 [Clostridiales Family XIII bacterium]|jgi:hypothetical protein|nr:hypothetical protein [Clostridiales Family XIII bacterium]
MGVKKRINSILRIQKTLYIYDISSLIQMDSELATKIEREGMRLFPEEFN